MFDYVHLSPLDLLLTKKIAFHSIEAISQPLEMYSRFGDVRGAISSNFGTRFRHFFTSSNTALWAISTVFQFRLNEENRRETHSFPDCGQSKPHLGRG